MLEQQIDIAKIKRELARRQRIGHEDEQTERVEMEVM
jgi:hypothetical protein